MALVFKGLIFSAADIFINSSLSVLEILKTVFTPLWGLHSKLSHMLKDMHSGVALANTIQSPLECENVLLQTTVR